VAEYSNPLFFQRIPALVVPEQWRRCISGNGLLPTALFTYRHHKNTYPAIHTAALSTVITRFLLYIV